MDVVYMMVFEGLATTTGLLVDCIRKAGCMDASLVQKTQMYLAQDEHFFTLMAFFKVQRCIKL